MKLAKSHYLKKYSFSGDWVSRKIPVWKKILGHLKGKPNLHYLEIGVFEGGSAIWMLENILTAPTSKITCIDIFPGELQEKFLANLRTSGFLEKATVIKGRSQIELRHLPLSSFDIIYIDGSHTTDDVLTDAVLSWELLKTGGIMIFDDYGWEEKHLPVELRPQIAIDSFIKTFGDYIEILHHGHQVMLRKLPIITYRNEKLGFSVDIPPDWKRIWEKEISGREPNCVKFLNSTTLSHFSVEANSVLCGGDAKSEAMKWFENRSETVFKETGYRMEIISEESSIINGLEGYQIVYKGPLYPPLLKAEFLFTEVFFVKETTVYRLTFAAKKEDFEKYQKKIFEDIILNSFKLD